MYIAHMDNRYMRFLTVMGLLFLFGLFLHLKCNAQSTGKVFKLTKSQLQAKKIDSLSTALRITQSNYDKAVKQLRIKDGQINSKVKQAANLKADLKNANSIIRNHEATIDTLNLVWDNCLSDIHDKMSDLQTIAFILSDKCLPRAKVRQIRCVIDK